jgi:chitin disaccharide deacetylase
MKNQQEQQDYRRRIFLHADDFGMNRGVTDGIIHGFRQGLLTSTSLLSNAPDSARALTLWQELLDDQAAARLPLHSARSRLEDPLSRFDLGVHLNLTQGRPLTERNYPGELLDSEGRFPGIFALFSRLKRHGVRLCRQIQTELATQVEYLADHGLQPTHLNGHQYIEMLPIVAEFIPQLLHRYNIRVVRVAEEPALVRSTLMHNFTPHVWLLAHIKQMFAKRFHRRMEQLDVCYPSRFHGTAHAGKIDMSLIRLFLNDKNPTSPIEIGLHPGAEIDADFSESTVFPNSLSQENDGWTDPLATSRPNELRLITSPELADYLETHNYRLARLSDLAAA